jgi:hypothetical protein
LVHEDFRLHGPGKPALPVEHEEAREIRQAVRRLRAGLKTPIKVEILDMIEEGDPVAVRWQGRQAIRTVRRQRTIPGRARS